MPNSHVVLKPGKEKAILNHHHWIFSGAVAKMPSFEDGEILPVYAHSNLFLGKAYFNKKSGIIGRMITFDDTSPEKEIERLLESAVDLREKLFDDSTNAYRLINGEGDFLPGLIVDRYADVLVLQVTTLGMKRLKTLVLNWFKARLNPRVIYEKSEGPSLKEEGLLPTLESLHGNDFSPVNVKENGLHFCVDYVKGQKTGFFCDHRQMRQQAKEIAAGKTVLNCFAYSGGFTVYALAGGAKKVDSLEISEHALSIAKQNVELNGFKIPKECFIQQDVFEFLRENSLHYDLVILDPPAFAKKQKDILSACRGYKDINRLAIKKMPPKSWLLTCSCSHHVDEALFQKVVFQAAVEAKRNVRIVGKHLMAADHPVNICHPESDYLKSLLLYVD